MLGWLVLGHRVASPSKRLGAQCVDEWEGTVPPLLVHFGLGLALFAAAPQLLPPDLLFGAPLESAIVVLSNMLFNASYSLFELPLDPITPVLQVDIICTVIGLLSMWATQAIIAKRGACRCLRDMSRPWPPVVDAEGT